MDLLYEPGRDANLRAAYSLANTDAGGQRFDVMFRPKAEGINDFTYTNHNDWQALRVGLCRFFGTPARPVPSPSIKCP